MISKLHAGFRKSFEGLPADIRRRARAAYRRFQANRQNPGVEFTALNAQQPLGCVRVNDGYRAVGVRNGEVIIWFFIGTHAEYDRLVVQHG